MYDTTPASHPRRFYREDAEHLLGLALTRRQEPPIRDALASLEAMLREPGGILISGGLDLLEIERLEAVLGWTCRPVEMPAAARPAS